MKRITLAAFCTVSAIYAGEFIPWNGADLYDHIKTGLGNETETEGYWYSFSDDWYNGASAITFPLESCPEYTCYPSFLDALFDYCKGFCGTAVLNRGGSTITPFAGVGFNVVGETSATDQTPAIGDASAWGVLCVTYKSDTDISLELGLGETIDSTMNYALPSVTLPASKTGSKAIVAWSDFKQPSWYNGAAKIDGETAAKQLAAIKFKIQSEPGEYNFNICGVGPKNGTCPKNCPYEYNSEASKAVRGTPAIKAILNGRVLRFTGIKATATVEVMNPLGQVVMKGVIAPATSTLNLASLDRGVYMVSVCGKNVHLTKKIALK